MSTELAIRPSGPLQPEGDEVRTLREHEARLRSANAELTLRVEALEKAKSEAGQSRRAMLNALEDAIMSRRMADENKRQVEMALREAEEAHRVKDRFLADLSHELRTPLSPILITAGMGAEDASLPERVRMQFEIVRTNVLLEARLIDDLLDQMKITRGVTKVEKQPLDVHKVLQQALRCLEQEFARKEISPDLQLRAAPTQVDGDPARLQQVFWNLFSNAVKFTPLRGRIVIETANPRPDRITIAITDNGLGMTADEVERAFDPFRQGEHAATREYGGLGLGLSIARKLIELHDGQIRIASAGRNQGTMLTVELPLLTKAAAPEQPPPDSADGRAVRPLRILLAEDHAPTRGALENLLLQHGHQLTAAGSMTDALARATGRNFDLLISDLSLPDGTGYELMRQLRIAQPLLMGIAVSGRGMASDIERSAQAGFAAHLIKPITVEQLGATIQQVAVLLDRGEGKGSA